MNRNKVEDFTQRADRMLHKMQTANELLRRAGRLSDPSFRLSLTDLKSLAQLGETLSLAMELVPTDPSRKETVDQLVDGLKKVQDLDLGALLQLASLFSAEKDPGDSAP